MQAQDTKICSYCCRSLLPCVYYFSSISQNFDRFLVLVLLSLLALVIYIIVKRRRSQGEQEYNVEAAQVEGPPTIITTEYNPASGPSGIYSSEPNGHKDEPFTEREMSHPAPVYEFERPPTYTAPVSKVTFSDQPYPFAYNAVSYRHSMVQDLMLFFWAEKWFRSTKNCFCHEWIP